MVNYRKWVNYIWPVSEGLPSSMILKRKTNIKKTLAIEHKYSNDNISDNTFNIATYQVQLVNLSQNDHIIVKTLCWVWI